MRPQTRGSHVTRLLLTLALLGVAGGGLLAAQVQPAANPFAADQEAIRTGMGLYRIRCADCHGIDARGVRGPDLTQVWASGRTDQGLFDTVRDGVPGTAMQPVRRIRDDELWKLLAYLRTLAAPAPTDPPRGNAANGEVIFRESCAGCHRVDAAGGRLGPDLSRIGNARSRDALVLRIRRGVEGQFGAGFAPVTLETDDGQSFRGVTKNEDLFSVQIMDTTERIQGFEKETLEELEKPTQSAMPVFGPDRLSDAELDDLVRYLQTLRGFDPAVQ